MNLTHISVMHDQVIAGLAIKPDGRYVDATYGRGGHAHAILAKLDENGRLLVMDRDPAAIAVATQSLGNDRRVSIIHDDFANLRARIAELELLDQFDGVLLDLGVSSPQLDDAERGFSFQHDGPLDMRMDPTRGQSASDWLARAEEVEISRVLWEYGEERYARRIAKRIVDTRQRRPIRRTLELAGLIAGCMPRPKNKRHPATRSFQAIRIQVNQELVQLQRLLESMLDILKIGGRLLVISFHSLEDRIVKRFFRARSNRQKLPRGLPLRDSEIKMTPPLKLVGKATKAGTDETARNPRARSAVLRIAERAA